VPPGGMFSGSSGRITRTEVLMSVAKVSEIIASSTVSFDDALQQGIARANKTLKNVTGAWIKSQKIEIQNGKIREYRVDLKVTFVLTD
jgi:flavin-binding protein dodecin